MATMFAFTRKSTFHLALLWLVLAGCSRPPASYQATIPAFGTLINITLPGVSSPEGDEITRLIEVELTDLHSRWHAWKPGELSELNIALAEGRPFEVSEPLAQILRASRMAYVKSQGLFDPASGGLIRMWGFHTDRYPVQTAAPNDKRIRQWLDQGVSFAALTLTANAVSSTSVLVQLDFGAIAKGMALERLAELLKTVGADDALLDFGGDVGALGGSGSDRWRVAIRHPTAASPIATIDLHSGEYVMTSGTYARYRKDTDPIQSHLLNPKSGQPAMGLASATVLHRSGSLADAAATALVVAGPGQWRDVARAMEMRCVLVVHVNGEIQVTNSMLARINLNRAHRVNLVADAGSTSAC